MARVIALNGEAGWQADPLPPGVYFWLWPFQYQVEFQAFIEVKDGQLGVVDAIDGVPLTKGRVLASAVDCFSFQDARKFLTNGGQRGPQVSVMGPGVYRINTQLFNVRMAQATMVGVDEVGIVTVSDGRQLAADSGEIAGPQVDGHNSFQDADAFMRAGGAKGLQEQVLLAGRYFINPLFATVDPVPMTLVPIAHVGVVISYVGTAGEDISGDDFKHGNLVKQGQTRRLGRAARSRQVPDQHAHAQGRNGADRQRGAELGRCEDRVARARREPVDDHGAVDGRFHVQSRRQPDHPHSAPAGARW